MKYAIRLTVLLTLGLLLSARLNVSAQTPSSGVKKWEYKIISDCGSITPEINKDKPWAGGSPKSDSDLNRLGDQGWELAGIEIKSTQTGTICRTYVFKRPKSIGRTSNPAPVSNCNLSLAQAPAIHGIRLGMNSKELMGLFSRDKQLLKGEYGIIQKKRDNDEEYGSTTLNFIRPSHYENNPMFNNNLYAYGVRLLDDRVVDIEVAYDFPRPGDASYPGWTLESWVAWFSGALNLPGPADWLLEYSYNTESRGRVRPETDWRDFGDPQGGKGNGVSFDATGLLICKGFKVLTHIGSSIRIYNSDLAGELKRREEAKYEKIQKAFKP